MIGGRLAQKRVSHEVLKMPKKSSPRYWMCLILGHRWKLLRVRFLHNRTYVYAVRECSRCEMVEEETVKW